MGRKLKTFATGKERDAGARGPDPATPQARRSAVSIHDVARRGGVSIATVSRVINNEARGVSSETRSRIQALVKEMNYQPSRIGRALRGQSSDTFALVISNIQNTLYAAIAWELERQLNEIGKVMLLFNTNEDPALQDRCFQEINARSVSGLFVLCAVESPKLAQTAERNHTVFINRRIDSLSDYSFVGIDDYSAARDITLKILNGQQLPLGIIHGPLYSDTSANRLRGVMDILRESDVQVDSGDIREASLSMDSGYQCAVELLQQRKYRAIFCGSDQIAYGAYRRCRELRLDVPRDVRIYGFDDNPLNKWLAPWLNTVRVPHAAFADEAISQLQKLREGAPHRSIILPYDIILRA